MQPPKLGKSSFVTRLYSLLPSRPQLFTLLFQKQELRKAVKDFNSPSPQLEDPGQALDPGLEEDPDISVELVDGTFYKASCDGTLVAIIANYPGLLPVLHVSRVGVLTSEKDSFVMPYLMRIWCTFIEMAIGTPHRAHEGSSAKGTRAGQA